MEIRGLTPIDTLYEFAGYSIGYRLSEYIIWNWYFPTILIGAALLRLFYMGYRKQSFADLVIYPLYVIFIAFLVWPIEVKVTAPGGTATHAEEGIVWDPGLESAWKQVTNERAETIRAPRILAVVHSITDNLVRHVVYDMEPQFMVAAFVWQRVAAINEKARILEPGLHEDFHDYLEYCYWPGMSTIGGAGWWNVPLLEPDEFLNVYKDEVKYRVIRREAYPEWMGYTPSCARFHAWLLLEVQEHLDTEPFHRQALEAYRVAAQREKNQRFAGERYREFYLRRMLYNEAFVSSDRNEVATVRTALPEFHMLQDRYWGTGNTEMFLNPGNAFNGTASFFPGAIGSMMEWWSLEAIGPTTYYKVSKLSPYIYGLVTAILLMGFPIAALLALWPGFWMAIVHFMRVFLSIKLWPIFWAFLSRMNIERGQFDPSDPSGFQGTFGQSEMFAALAGMYLLVPVISWLLISLAWQVGNIGLGALVGPGNTGSGQAVLLGSHAARSAVSGGIDAVSR